MNDFFQIQIQNNETNKELYKKFKKLVRGKGLLVHYVIMQFIKDYLDKEGEL